MTFICCIIAWGILLSWIWAIYRNFQVGVAHLQRLHQVPCYRCKYFVDSCYLKCTINPQTACSESAIDCRDYQAQ